MAEPAFVPPWQRRRQLAPAKPRVEAGAGGHSPYKLGRAFEYSIRGRLERRDYYVMRAAMSKGAVDLLAVGMPCLTKGISALFVQCKRRGDIPGAEWNELYELGQRFGAWPVVAVKLSEKTVGFYRIDERREPKRVYKKWPWTLFEPRDLSEFLPPPSLL